MIGQGLGRLALAEKLSIGQLQEAIQNKTIPAYIGIPLLEEKMMFEQRMRSAGQGIAPQMNQPPIAEQVMAQASQMGGMGEMSEEGIDQLPVPTPELAGGGIVAFEDGGQVQRFQNQGLVSKTQEEIDREAMLDTLRRMKAAGMDILTLPGRGIAGAAESVITRPLRALGVPIPYLPSEFYGGDASSITPYYDRLRAEDAAKKSSATPTAPAAPTPPAAPAPAATTAPATTTKAPPKAPKSEVSLITEEAQKLMPRQGLTPESFKAQQAAFGIGADPDADFRKRIEELAKGTKEERQQAKYMALIQAGLGIMGGTSANALENIAAGAQKGLAQYGADIRDIKKEERDLMKMQAELARAEDARKRGDFKAFQDASDRADDLKLKQEKLAIDRQTAAIQKAYYEGRLTDAQYRNSLAKARLGQSQVQATLKAREFFMDREEPALRSEFEKRFGKNWAKSPELMMQFNRQKEGRIRDLAMLGGQDSGIPSAEDLMED